MRKMSIGAGCLIGALLSQPVGARDVKAWGNASSAGRDALVVAALGLPAIEGDWTGDLETGGSMIAAFGISEGLKAAFPERRPNGSDDKSFPSGHASVSFAAAASLQNRYGWKVGLPAQLVAAFVGLGRVEARKHHWYDVVAGAAVGEGSGFPHHLQARRQCSCAALGRHVWRRRGDHDAVLAIEAFGKEWRHPFGSYVAAGA